MSGAEKSLLTTLYQLKRNNYRVILVLPNAARLEMFNDFNCIYLPLINFRKSINPGYLIKVFFNLFRITNSLRKLIIKENIELVYSNSIKAHLYGVALKIVTNCRIIFHVRDKMGNKLLTKISCYYADQVFCVSKFIYDQISVPATKKKLIYAGIVPPLAVEMIDMVQTKDNRFVFREEVKYIAQVSQITQWKNHIDFIKAARLIACKYQNVHFILVGESYSPQDIIYRNQLEKIIKDFDLNNKVSWLGFQENIYNIYSKISILVHPVISEPFGRVMVEAMTMNIPVIAYNSGGAKEIVLNNATGYLIEPNNVVKLADKIGFLLQNEGVRMNLGKAGALYAKEKFNIPQHTISIKEGIGIL